MDDKDESAAAVWLAAMLHEVLQPVATAQLEAGLAAEHLERAGRALRRSALGSEALRWLVRVLRHDDSALAVRDVHSIATALQAIETADSGLDVEVPAHLAVLSAPGALELVLSNLINNAREHASGAKVTVRASCMDWAEAWLPAETLTRLHGRIVRLSVADDGPGIRDEGRLFEPFGTAYPGRGIGLWLCRLIVRAHGGDLWLDVTEQGTCFTSIWQHAEPPHPGGWPRDRIELGKALRAARITAGMTRAELGSLAGVADSTIRNIEVAKHQCTPFILSALTDALASVQVEGKWINTQRRKRRPR